MILTWPEVIGYINMYLNASRLYAFLLMLAALLVTQIVKHFMIRRNMGLESSSTSLIMSTIVRYLQLGF